MRDLEKGAKGAVRYVHRGLEGRHLGKEVLSNKDKMTST